MSVKIAGEQFGTEHLIVDVGGVRARSSQSKVCVSTHEYNCAVRLWASLFVTGCDIKEITFSEPRFLVSAAATPETWPLKASSRYRSVAEPDPRVECEKLVRPVR